MSKKQPEFARIMSRRKLLTTSSVAMAMSISGCSNYIPLSQSKKKSEIAEVGVDNSTDDREYVSVIVSGDNDIIFRHTFILDPGTFSSEKAIEEEPSEIMAFTKNGISKTWNYDPEMGPAFDCGIKDIGLTLQDDTIEPWYDCP
ncbi:hypothetical protein [Natrialba taiwanensis]|uniref:hypothetical protein n=1 Tax=Natrialba taiwanensis TaxID=160846 RepID=UPI00126885A2|nr:hypothetical protein [Natrialba taiwanensis]